MATLLIMISVVLYSRAEKTETDDSQTAELFAADGMYSIVTLDSL